MSPINSQSTNKQPLPLLSTDKSQALELVQNAGPGPSETALSIPAIKSPVYPVWYFFCCNLTEPAILKAVLKLEKEPVLRPASIQGYAVSHRGKYPVLIDGHMPREVSGYAYEIQSKEQEVKLASYNVGSYKVRRQLINFPTPKGKDPKGVEGKVFIHRGQVAVEWRELQS